MEKFTTKVGDGMESKPRLTFKQCMILSVVSVTLFVALMNFGKVMATAYSLFTYILPLFVGACIAFAINVPMKAFERFFAFIQRKCRLKVRHALNTYVSLVFTFATVVGVGVLFAYYVAPQLTDSAVEIAEKFKEWYPDAIALLNRFGVETETLEDIFKNFDVDKAINYVKDHITINPDDVVNTVISAASSTFSAFVTALSCIIFSIYMVTSKKKLNLQARQLIYAYTPKPFADRVCYIGSLTYKTFYNFISSQCLDAGILALLLYVSMLIFDIPYAGIICVFTGVFALVPYIGAFVSCIIGALLIALVSPVKALIFLVIFIVIQQIEGQLIYPHLVGNSVGLPAIWTLFAALVGGELMGIFGLLTFIPITAVIYTLIKEGAVKRLKEKNLRVECPIDTEEKEKQKILAERRRQRVEKRKGKKRTKIENSAVNQQDDSSEE